MKIQLLKIHNQVEPCGIGPKINFYNFILGRGSEDNKELEISLHEHQRFVHQILILQDAKRMYFEREQKQFLLDHYWNVVLHAHKWQPFEGYQSSSFVNTSPIGASTPLDEDLSMETILKTQEFMQTSNPR
ncbi:hypothetical protein GBA52_009072 [Prunus armeniaca]|nr:hypothetical protein GBA52_009072 [Prunus armeniaca]